MEKSDIQQLLIASYNKKKLAEIADNTDSDTKKKKKVSDPLAGMKAVTKHYGTHNRLE